MNIILISFSAGGLLTAGVGAALGVGKVNSKINTIANVVNSKANLLNFKTNLVNTGINGARFVNSCECETIFKKYFFYSL